MPAPDPAPITGPPRPSMAPWLRVNSAPAIPARVGPSRAPELGNSSVAIVPSRAPERGNSSVALAPSAEAAPVPPGHVDSSAAPCRAPPGPWRPAHQHKKAGGETAKDDMRRL